MLKLHVEAVSVRILYKVGQQASLSRTLGSHTMVVYFVSETHKQDQSVVIHLSPPSQCSMSLQFALRVSRKLTTNSHRLSDICVASSSKAKQTS